MREQSYKDECDLSRKLQSRRDNRTTEVIFIARPIYPRSVEGDKKLHKHHGSLKAGFFSGHLSKLTIDRFVIHHYLVRSKLFFSLCFSYVPWLIIIQQMSTPVHISLSRI